VKNSLIFVTADLARRWVGRCRRGRSGGVADGLGAPRPMFAWRKRQRRAPGNVVRDRATDSRSTQGATPARAAVGRGCEQSANTPHTVQRHNARPAGREDAHLTAFSGPDDTPRHSPRGIIIRVSGVRVPPPAVKMPANRREPRRSGPHHDLSSDAADPNPPE
jgi:hypothetical protein